MTTELIINSRPYTIEELPGNGIDPPRWRLSARYPMYGFGGRESRQAFCTRMVQGTPQDDEIVVSTPVTARHQDVGSVEIWQRPWVADKPSIEGYWQKFPSMEAGALHMAGIWDDAYADAVRRADEVREHMASETQRKVDSNHSVAAQIAALHGARLETLTHKEGK